MHNYHDTYSALPPARLDYDGGVTWAVIILPYIEQGTFYNQWDTHEWYYVHKPEIRKHQLSIYYCPSRRRASDINVSKSGDTPDTWPWGHTPPVPPDQGNSWFGATGDYASNDGDNGPDGIYNTEKPKGAIIHWTPENNAKIWDPARNTPPARIKQWTSKTKFANIEDGLSNTLLVG